MSQTNISVNSTLGPTIEVLSDGGIIINVANPVSGTGDVTGSSLSLDNQITRFNGTNGRIIQNSGITIADGASGTLAGTNSGDVTIGTANGLSIAGQALSLGTSSASTTGALTSTNWSTFNSKQPAGNYITELTGDVTASGPGSAAATLASTAVTPGAYTLANITVDSKGRITSAANGSAGTGTVTSVGITGTDGIQVDSGSPVTTSGSIQLGVDAATMKTTLNLAGTNTGDQNLFGTFAVAGQSNVVADSTNDTLTLVAGSNITITTNSTTDAITINSTASGSGDVVGPASATDNAIARYDQTTGKLIQDSGITIADGESGTLSGTNTGDVTLAGSLDYLSISGQDITLDSIDLATDVTGNLPLSNMATLNSGVLLGSDSTGNPNNPVIEISIGGGLTLSGGILYAPSPSPSGDVFGPSSATNNAIVRFDTTTGKLIQDSGITIADGESGTLSGTNSGDQNLFGTIAVAGQSNVEADSTNDTLTLVAGTNITITTNASTDSITINSTASGGGTPGGLDTQVQFNDGGNFGGDAGLTYNKTTDTLSATNLTVSGLSTLAHIHGSIAGNLYVHVKNTSGVTLAKGTPVYAIGSVGVSGRIEVAAADYTNSAKMPAIGITDAELIANAEGNAVVVGEVTGLATNSYAINQELFVGTSGLLGTFPTTGEAQSIAVVSRVHASTGIIVVNSQARLSNGAITNARLANMAANTIKGRVTASTGAPENITPTSLTEETAPAAGDFLLGWESGGGIRKFDVGDLLGVGDVVGPASATDNAIARFDGTTGKIIQNSGSTINDAGEITTPKLYGTNGTSSGAGAGGAGGSVFLRGGAGSEDGESSLPGGGGGSIDLRGGDSYVLGEAVNSGGFAGGIYTFGSNANSVGIGNNGGNITTSGSEDGPGGSINTAGGGGSIDTKVGFIELGENGSRTILQSGATSNYTITFPPTAGSAGQVLGVGVFGVTDWVTPAGGGDVVGPASSTSFAIAQYSDTTGKLIKDSSITIVDGASGTLSGTNSGDQNLFGIISVAGQSNVVADSTNDTLTLVAGSNITITTNATTDSITINSTANITNVWIPASAFIPRTTTGCGVDSVETVTNRQNFDQLLFDPGTNEFAQALTILPNNYNSGTITARFYWTASSGSGAVVWGIQGLAYSDDDALDTATGTAQTVTDTLLAANDMHVSTATSAVTLAGTPAANRPIQFQIYRDATAGGDTLAVDARLLGVEILYTGA